MAIWTIGDLHLSFDTPGKEMALFGPVWIDHHKKIAEFWDSHVGPNDLVLIPEDISWAMRLDQAKKDLEWIDARPGTKVMIRGNHDYWWDSASKIRKNLPPSLHIISNDAFHWNDVAVAGARLWDTNEYNFSSCIDMKETKGTSEPVVKDPQEDQKIFERELHRLSMSLQAMNKNAALKIVMTHYPPIGKDLEDSTVSKMLKAAGVHVAVFGHLHSLKPNLKLFGTKEGISYHLVSCDWLDFKLLKIAD